MPKSMTLLKLTQNKKWYEVPEWYLGLVLVLSSTIEVSKSILSFVIDTNACFDIQWSFHYLWCSIMVLVNLIIWRRWTNDNGCTVTDALPSSLKVFVILVMWRGQTFRMVLCVVHVLTVRIRRNTLPEKSFTPTCFRKVSCLDIIVGPSTEKEGL
jgi:hypothetical protein